MPLFSSPKGTKDIPPEQYYARLNVSNRILKVLESYGYKQLSTPAFEEIEVFTTKAGQGIIEQIYDFHDKGDRHLALRSDITASVGRFIAAQIGQMPKPVKFSCYDRVWRYESPQSGRFREFYQINAEMFGTATALADAELLACFCACYDAIELHDYKIHIGHRILLEDFVSTLGVDKDNILDVIRVIDKAPKISPEEFEKEVVKAGLPNSALHEINEFIDMAGDPETVLERAYKQYSQQPKLKSHLDEMKGIFDYLKFYGDVISRCVLDFGIARGSDYYTGIIFECVYNTNLVGSIGGGGRYDDLVSVYGGSDTPATGFSIGIERIMILLDAQNDFDTKAFMPHPDYYVVAIDETAYPKCIELLQFLRNNGFDAEIDLLCRKVGKQLNVANKLNAEKVIIIGPDELESGTMVVRDMKTGDETTVNASEWIASFS